MRNRWPFSLLNDEQFGSQQGRGASHQPVYYKIEQWKKPWLFLLYIGDEILPNYIGIIIMPNHYIGIPFFNNQDFSWRVSKAQGFFGPFTTIGEANLMYTCHSAMFSYQHVKKVACFRWANYSSDQTCKASWWKTPPNDGLVRESPPKVPVIQVLKLL